MTLFETIPRAVTFKPTQSYGASTDGNGVYIDGVALGKGSGGTTSAQGSLQALLQLRDEVAPTFQSQLDEIAKGLVALFSETNTAGTSTLRVSLPGRCRAGFRAERRRRPRSSTALLVPSRSIRQW
ncbi:hypothetical protein AJ87_06470 [Rhizobium yanglingense]|nr:hypothetical protein AJ87_06470 [Rhizobium yanglingense]